jgi:hypothetical protein
MCKSKANINLSLGVACCDVGKIVTSSQAVGTVLVRRKDLNITRIAVTPFASAQQVICSIKTSR